MADIIDEFFIRQKIVFDIQNVRSKLLFASPKYEENENYEEIFGNTIRKIKEIQPILVQNKTFIGFDTDIINSLIVFNPEQKYHERVFMKFRPNDLSKKKFLEFHTACNYDVSKIEPQSLSGINFPVYFMNLYIFCQQNETVFDLITYEWFDAESCKKVKIKVLNKFNLESMEWQKPLKNYEKFKNLNRCPLKVNKYFYPKNRKDKHLSQFGDLLHIVGDRANFTLNFNSSFSEIDININQEYATNIIHSFGKYVTSPINTVNIGLMVSKNENYTAYEKLLLPFDETTWILLIITFCIAFVLIFIFNQMNDKIQKVVFGEGVTRPLLNVVSTFFGIALPKLPKLSFARFILMNFILFCLVIRTAYQGVLFDYMNSDMRKPLPKTIDEVFDKNYRILANYNHSDKERLFYESIDVERRAKIDNITIKKGNIRVYCQYIGDKATKTAIVTDERFDMMIKFFCKEEILRIKETVFTVNVGYGLVSFHYLYDSIESTIQWLLQAGIPQFWYELNHWHIYKRIYIPSSPPKDVLTLNDLNYGFNIWLIACAISIFQFFIEVIVGKITKYRTQKSESVESLETSGNLKSVEIQEISIFELFENIDLNEDQTELENQMTEIKKTEIDKNDDLNLTSINKNQKSSTDFKNENHIETDQKSLTDIDTIIKLQRVQKISEEVQTKLDKIQINKTSPHEEIDKSKSAENIIEIAKDYEESKISNSKENFDFNINFSKNRIKNTEKKKIFQNKNDKLSEIESKSEINKNETLVKENTPVEDLELIKFALSDIDENFKLS
ncbi:hypothetical protein PVAND_016245 [Polypedilum vanderplanki]|uniref:Uncharacterized protein n=1 Tax=Polypedilum vanderplanki TaxID=319348 RepID=A0A9J6BF09_POLVA|nr:hypothetical protein PVAND_016245 [Polypedilum vanderplanki]